MDSYKFLLVGVLSFLLGCNLSDNPYQKKNGVWYYDDKPITIEGGELTPLNNRFAKSATQAFYRGDVLPESDGQSFVALSEHYAKDKSNVYYCETYRDGQDYFMTKRNRIVLVKGADPGTLRIIKDGYARDKTTMIFEGKVFMVKDINSFEILDYGFGKDNVSGYYQQTIINGSNGKTFTVLDNHYSKDSLRVYYSNMEHEEDNAPYKPVTYALNNARPGTFKLLNDGYAVDDKHVYFKNRLLNIVVENFKVLQNGYAKTDKEVFYWGELIAGGDASSFTVIEHPTDAVDAKDKHAFYQQGKKIK